MSCGEELVQELRRRKHRVTPQRAVILETIAHLDGHPTAQQVFDEASARLPGLNLATVYRTLETLQSIGLVDLFHSGTGSVRFALHGHGDPHGHLVCTHCGSVTQFHPAMANGMVRQVAQAQSFAINVSHLTLRGICQACQDDEGLSQIEGGSG